MSIELLVEWFAEVLCVSFTTKYGEPMDGDKIADLVKRFEDKLKDLSGED